MVGLLALAGANSAARADVAALFADGHGGIENAGGGDMPGAAPSTTGLGYRLGARPPIFTGKLFPVPAASTTPNKPAAA